MSTARFLLIAALGAACVDPATSTDDTALAEDDVVANVPAPDDPSADNGSAAWISAETLHANMRLNDFASANERNVHSLWIAGSNANRVPLAITARAGDGYDVRIAVLGPVTNGSRAVLAADGYSAPKRSVSVTLDVATRGEHLVVIGSYGLANDTFYELTAQCDNCDSRVDVLASPKFYGLVGNDQRIVSGLLGDVMLGYNADVEVEVWTSPPMQWWNATKVSSAYASGTQVNAILPSAVAAGDDVRLVVREPGGRVLDTGVTTRYVPTPTTFARLDKILYGDIASLQIAGVVGFFEGQADLRLRSETHDRELASDIAHVDYPGHVGNGFNAFDATFMPDLSVAAADGELLSIGFINGNGDYRRLGCFEYCNNLSGLSSCTGGPRACP
jgi:hypothetical protein